MKNRSSLIPWESPPIQISWEPSSPLPRLPMAVVGRLRHGVQIDVGSEPLDDARRWSVIARSPRCNSEISNSRTMFAISSDCRHCRRFALCPRAQSGLSIRSICV